MSIETQKTIDLSEMGEGQYVKIANPQLLGYDDLKSLGEQAQSNDAEAGFAVCAALIDEWNVNDRRGNPLPPLAEDPTAIRRVPVIALKRILEEIGSAVELAIPKDSATP